MIKRSFFSSGKPGLKYLSIVEQGLEVKEVSLPAEVRLLVKDCDIGAINLKVGTPVKTGQKVVLTFIIFSASAIELPPYFWTISLIFNLRLPFTGTIITP